MRRFSIRTCLLLVLSLLTANVIAGVQVETQTLRLQFTEQGNLLEVEACFPACDDAHAKMRTLSPGNGMLAFGQLDDQVLALNRQRSGQSTVLSWSDESGELVRRWRVPDEGWLIGVESPRTNSATLASGPGFRPVPSSGFGDWLEQTRYLKLDSSSVEAIGLDETDSLQGEHTGWLGFRNRFWTAMLQSSRPLGYKLSTGEDVTDARVELNSTNPGMSFSLYLGPVEPGALSRSAEELEDLMYTGLWFWLRWICQALYVLLNAISMVIPQWGLAVMALSVAVGILMRPLSKIADRLQDQVHETEARLAPALAVIKKDYKGAEQSEKILALYKSENVHPLYSLKSLVGVFVVIPVFIGAFDMLAENIHLSGESFLWIADLSHPDAFMRLPFELPFFGGYLNLLPFIMTAFSFVASKMHGHPAMDEAQRRKHSRNLLLMALGFLVLFYTFPAGMVLYWTTNNLISVIKALWKKRKLSQTPLSG
jgi:YidC/Oxa1 family membrane protein insertase